MKRLFIRQKTNPLFFGTLFSLFLALNFSQAQSVGGAVSPANTTVCAGTNSGLLTLSGHTGNVVRWQSSTTGGAAWTNIANTTVNLVYSNLTVTTWYRCEVLLLPSPPNVAAFSTPAIITVDAASSGAITSNATVCSGSNGGTLNLAGTFTSVNYWEYSTNGGSMWTNIANISASENYTNLTTTTLYRANITNGTCSASNSTAATITLNPVTISGSVSGTASECSGSNSGTLTLSGHTGSVVRWESSTNGGVSWTTIANTTTFNNYLNITQTTEYRAVVQSGVCAADNSTSATITVDPASVGGTVSGAASVCTGANSGTLTLSTQTGNVIRWEESTNGGASWNPIVNTATTQNYTNLTATTMYRAVVQSGTCVSANSSSGTITVSPNTVGGTVSGSASVCAESNSGTLTLSGHTGSVVRWESSTNSGVSWNNITNTTTINNYSNITQTTDYRAVVQSGTCAADNSSSATITVFPVSVGGTIASGTTVCSGSNNGTLVLSGYAGNIIQWEYSTDGGVTWIIIANITDNYTYNNLTLSTKFRTLVQSGGCADAYSATVTITVTPISAGGSVAGSASACAGSNSGTLVLSAHTGSVLRWESSTDGGVSWTNITNTSTIYNYSNITQTTDYRAVVQSGSCAIANSSLATIIIFPISVGGTVNSSATVCSGANNGTLLLTGYTGNVLSWEYSIDNGTTWTTIGNTTDTFSYTNLTIKTLYKANVQSGNCAIKKSSTATITVNLPSVGGMVSGSDTVCSGSNSGTLQLIGYVGNIVRWQSSIDGGVAWTNITNTTAILNYTNITATTNYRAVIQTGQCPTANSTEAIITVFPVSVGGTLSPAGFAACSGINSGTILLSGESGNVINWESSIDGGITWTPIANTTVSQNFQNLTVTTMYRAVVRNGQCAAAYSATSTISIFPTTVGGTASGSDTVCAGTNNGSITLTVFTGSILNWEFSIDGGVTWTNITNNTAIQNYTNLTITTMYRAVVQSGSCSTANSTAATITVNPATVGGSVLSSTSVCDSLTSGTLTLSGYTGTILNWEKSTDGGITWTIITNTSNTYTFTGITTQTTYKANVQSGTCTAAASAAATISLAVPAVASYSVNINGATVTFTNTSTSNNGTSFWNFGDNTTSTITSPAHTYTANGSYPVILIVTDSCGADTVIQTVIITGIGIDELAYNNPNVNIYPNPFSTTASLSINPPLEKGVHGGFVFVMFDVYGKEVVQHVIPGGTRNLLIERNNLSSGLYFYKLSEAKSRHGGNGGEVIATGKIMIE